MFARIARFFIAGYESSIIVPEDDASEISGSSGSKLEYVSLLESFLGTLKVFVVSFFSLFPTSVGIRPYVIFLVFRLLLGDLLLTITVFRLCVRRLSFRLRFKVTQS